MVTILAHNLSRLINLKLGFPNSGAVSVGGVTTYTDENGVEVQNTISRQIINVAAGTEDSDAVNVAQLKKVVALTDTNKAAINTNKDAIVANAKANQVNAAHIAANTDAINANALAIADTKQDVTAVNNRVSKLDNRMDKVGASAAALAALHPLQFDENNRFTVAAGFGNYKGEQAVALGGFYHANEDLLFSLGGTLGDENMVNAGVSVRFGEKSDVVNPTAPTAVRDLSNEVASLKAKNEGLESTVASQQEELTAQKDQLAKQAATLEAQQKVIEQLMTKVSL
ncbi:YadA-like family protein [uncultured Veillonella sp.]|uniref:YadA-like family protein n=1 Tax=uncultured Veillonella sp. TaxID=159268 RepID=UPI002627A08F|nr:YadA-like family protein [uncultured Veillonella sp.]